MRTNLCGGSSPALDPKGTVSPAIVAALAGMQTTVAPSGVTFVSRPVRRPMPPSRVHEVVRREDEWRDLAEAKGLVCVRKGEKVFIATVGPEPESYTEWLRAAKAGRLDRGGRGYVLLDGFGEPTITHNLSGEVEVPSEFHHLFEPNYVAVKPLDQAAENRHWFPAEPWAEAA